jgi:DNA-binding SARP family transcriptional activator
VHYRLLGPLQVLRDGSPVDIGPPKQRAALAVLLLADGGVVSVDRLIDAIWGDDVPASATASLQAYVSNLRKALRADDGAVASPIVR